LEIGANHRALSGADKAEIDVRSMAGEESGVEEKMRSSVLAPLRGERKPRSFQVQPDVPFSASIALIEIRRRKTRFLARASSIFDHPNPSKFSFSNLKS